ncbi:hypothetical protein ABZW10_33175 [Kitasatospora sp. NPDC004723]|uniref:hypothetical protein n=1 Tax=Kitasatospora sp. NPDC004723 TaxID=3154288 RepID=UPI0033B087BF
MTTDAAQTLAAELTERGISAEAITSHDVRTVAIPHTVYEAEYAVLHIEPADASGIVAWRADNGHGEPLDWGAFKVPAHCAQRRTVDRVGEWLLAHSSVPGRPTMNGFPQHYTRHHLLMRIEAASRLLRDELALGGREAGLAELALDTLLYLLDHQEAELDEVIAEQYGVGPADLYARWAETTPPSAGVEATPKEV